VACIDAYGFGGCLEGGEAEYRVANSDARYSHADNVDHPSELVSESLRECHGHVAVEIAAAQFRLERLNTGSLDPDANLARTDPGLRDLD
jgi:hypothetical protein